MKIILFSPSATREQAYGDWDLSCVDTKSPPLGLLSIAACLRAAGHRPLIVDMAQRGWSLDEAARFTAGERPDVVGIGAMTISMANAGGLAQRLREDGFRGPLILGGAHVTAVPRETLLRFPAFDYGVVGEGEYTLKELLDRLQSGASTDAVAGTARRAGGEIIINPGRQPIEDLDALPFPAWDLLPAFPRGYPHSPLETRRLPAASLITSRGCPYHCSFCDTSVFGSRVRSHSAGYVLRMIRLLRESYGIRDLMFFDDNFLLDKQRLFAICDGLIRERAGLRWFCCAHVNQMTRDRLEMIKKAGCWIIEAGIESGCERILRQACKNSTKEEIAEAVREARRAGLEVKGNFIFGLPGETKESLEETISFAGSVGITLFQQNFLTLWPGSPLARAAGKQGAPAADWQSLAHQRVSFVPQGLTRDDLIAASKDAFRRFYLRPGIAARFCRRLDSFRAWKAAFSALAAFAATLSRK